MWYDTCIETTKGMTMGKFVKYDGDILLPVQVVGVDFFEKENISLNCFQTFLLEAVEQGHSISQIAEATILTEYVIETEIMQMIDQKLLVKEHEGISLSDLSKKILMVSRCVKKLNDEHKKVCINLFNGNVEGYDTDKFRECKDESDIFLRPNISGRDIDGIGVEENITFFRSYMDTLSELDDKQIEPVLESIYIVFNTDGQSRGYKPYSISFLPCALHEDELKEISGSENEEMIYAQGELCKISYYVESETVDANKEIIPDLIKVEQMDAEMLSEKGRNIIERYKEFEAYEQKELVCYYDTVSGYYQFERPSELGVNRMNTNIELPVQYAMAPDYKDCFIKKLKEYFLLSDDLTVYEKNCESEEYFVTCSLNDLRSGDDD